MKHTWKRTFDVVMSAFGLIIFGWMILVCWLIASIETGSNGMFIQTRIGRGGIPFRIYKIKTMYNPNAASRSTVTLARSMPITPFGKIMRRYKLDELPQLLNVFVGQMSFVGPRPDVAGFADQLSGSDRIVLTLRPGITGPASLEFRNEEDVLSDVDNPEEYNRTVIWPAKVALNKIYARDFGFWSDIHYIIRTIMR